MSRSVRDYLHHMLDETHYLVRQTINVDKARFLSDDAASKSLTLL